jgi:hypothetical protein
MKSGWVTELEAATAAKNGDMAAMEALWVKYRKPMANVFYGLPMTPEERESEAADVFMHYIKNLFDPEREENRREGWKFFSYLYSGMVGRRSRLRRARAYLSYDESAGAEDGDGALNAETACLFNRDLFMRYNPEDAVLDLDFKLKAKQLHGTLNRLEKIKMEYSRYVQDLFGSVRNNNF